MNEEIRYCGICKKGCTGSIGKFHITPITRSEHDVLDFYLHHYLSYSHAELTNLLNRYRSGDVYLSEIEYDALYSAWESPYFCPSDYDSFI